MKKFICTVCGYIYEGETAPEKCPLCKAPASKFKEMEEAEGGLQFVRRRNDQRPEQPLHGRMY